MKKRFVKKFAILLFVKKNDPDCRCYDRAIERHKLYYYRRFWYFIRVAKKRDWYWYYYFQARNYNLGKLNHEESIAIANKCIKDYEEFKERRKI